MIESVDSRPIIIGGCYRSGTSLVRRLLNAHSRIYCGPEVKFFRDFYADYFSDPVKHLRFTVSARSMLPEDELLPILGQAFIDLHKRAAMRAGKSRWADKNPENVLYLNQWQQLLGAQWLMIHVARNPLDTLASMKEHRFPLTLPADLESRIELYKRYNQAALDFAKHHRDRYYRLIYEQLISAPEHTLRHLMHWLGERFETQQMRFNSVDQQSGLEDPKIKTTTHIHEDSSGRWRQLLEDDEVKLIKEKTTALWSQLDEHSLVLLN